MDMTPKQRLTELLVGLSVERENVGSCKLTEIKRIEGEATANNRKAKLIFLYEWDIKCAWEGFASGSDEKINGSITVPNLSDEFTADEIDVDVSVDSGGAGAESLRELLLTDGVREIRQRLAQYIQELKQEFSKGLILPTKNGSTTGTKVEEKIARDSRLVAEFQAKKEVVLNPAFADKHSNNVGVLISTKTLELKEEFKCRASDLYNAFTTPEMVQAFTNGPCQLEAVKGGKFMLYHGMVEGVFDEMVMHIRTTLQFEETEAGWKRNYFEAMKSTFGFGARLL